MEEDPTWSGEPRPRGEPGGLRRWLAQNEIDALGFVAASGCLLLGFEASVRGRLVIAAGAAALAVLVLGLSASALARTRPALLAGLALAPFWAVAAVEMTAAAERGEPLSPILLVLPLAAFAGLHTGPAWGWSGLAAATAIGLPPLVERFGAATSQGADHILRRESFLLAVGVLAVAIGASLQRARGAARERRLEGELESWRRAESEVGAAQRGRTRQVANVSHELRTPLHGVIGLIELVLRGELAPAERRQLEWAHNSAELLLSLIDDLLDLDRLDQGRFTLRPRPFDLPELVQGVARLLAPRARAKGLGLAVTFAPGLPRFAVGDPRRLRQILLNLVGNAVKFTRQGSIEVTISRHGGTAERPLLRFEVRDTGPGFPADRAEQLFERYERGVETSDRLFPSSGLGLAISRELALAMGGRMGAASPAEGGALFWLEVPLDRANESALDITTMRLQQPAAEPRVQRPAADLRVLVVEDDPIARELAVAQLRAIGIVGESVDRGEDALARLAAKRFDAVLLDVEMPGIGGLETVRRIRRGAPAEPRLVVLALTARALAEEQAVCLAAGMDDCLIKPTSLETLRQTLAHWLATPLAPPAEASEPPPRGEASAEARPSSVDEDRITDLEALGKRLGQPILATLIASFRTRSAELVDELDRALAEGDAAALGRAAHTLAGTAANLGAAGLSQTARALERLAARGEVDRAAPEVESARVESVAAVAALERHPAAAPGGTADGEEAGRAASPL